MSFGRTSRKWTTEEIDRAKELDSQGALISEIAAELKRTATAVRAMLYRLHDGHQPAAISGRNSRKAWTVDEHKAVVKLRKSGLTWKAIGERLGRSAGSVQTRIGRYNPDGSLVVPRDESPQRTGSIASPGIKAPAKPKWCYVVGDKFAPVGKCDHLPLGGSFEDRVVP